MITKKLIYLFIVLLSITQISCFKTAIITDSAPLSVSVDAVQGSVSLSPIFPVVVTINSSINTNVGLEIKNEVIEEISGLPVEPQAPVVKTAIAKNNTAIINLPRQKWCVVNIKVTDIGNVNNTITKSFRLIYK